VKEIKDLGLSKMKLGKKKGKGKDKKKGSKKE
jgi:hypothetical protein